MSAREREQLKELQAKAKRVERQQKEFLSYADDHKDELLERWNMSDTIDASLSDKIKALEKKYDDDFETLFKHFISDQQVTYYKRTKEYR